MIAKFFLLFLTWLTIIALMTGAYGGGQAFERLTGVPPIWLIAPTWAVLGVFMARKSQFIYSKMYTLAPFVLLGVSSVATVVLSVWGYISPPNHVYALTRIQPQNLGLLPIFLGGILFLTRTTTWWKNYFRTVLFWGPLAFLATLLVARFWPADYFDQLIKEDHLVEYLQVLVLAFGSFIAARSLILKRFKVRFLELVILVLGSTTLLFLAGEEISWGQRLLGLTTPEHLAEINLQKEITLHNIQSVQWSVEIAYVIIGLLGGTLWLVANRVFPEKLRAYIPAHYLAFFFIIPGLYYLYPLYSTINLHREWSEVMELLLYMGVVAHVSQLALQAKSA